MTRDERKQRLALNLLFSGVVFGILMVSLLIALCIFFVLMQMGVVFAAEWSPLRILLMMVLISDIVGLLVAVLVGKVPLAPINELITRMNRLASGDYQARLEYSKRIRSHPTFRDLSDSFNTMARELEKTEMLRSDFINNFSHEFKTPIVSIAGFAKLLRRGNLDEKQQQEYLAIIEEESLRLAAMATNVLQLTKIENQTILTDVTAYNLSEQIRSCVLLLEEKWSRKNLELELEFAEHRIRANEELMMQVWINLLDNAIKFTPESGEIRVDIQKKPETVHVSITNYGSEIPEEKISRIWNKFYQAEESHATQGNGVGLAVVKGIVQLHKGTVGVSSADGVTTFWVELPLMEKQNP